jgi:hypothetical protein
MRYATRREEQAAAVEALEAEATAVMLHALEPVIATITDHLLGEATTIEALTASLTEAHNPYHDERGRFTHGPGGGQQFGRRFESRQSEYDYGMEASERWRSNLNEAGRRGVERYARIGGGEWRQMNDYLRNNRAGDAEIDTAIEELDEAFFTSGAELPDDLTLHRGMRGEYTTQFYEAHQAGNLVGTTIRNPGYSSTTMNQDRATDWAFSGSGNPVREKPVVLEIQAPAGTPAIFPGDLSAHGVNETEWVLPRGSEFEVVDAYEDSSRMVRDSQAMSRRNDHPMLRIVVRPVLR